MGTTDGLEAADSDVPLAQLCYDIAYRWLTVCAFQEFDEVRDVSETSPETVGELFYSMACDKRGVEPDAEAAAKFRWHHGRSEMGREYFVLEYPTPRPVDYTGMTPERLEREYSKHILAPHFSAILLEDGDPAVKYFVLGQAPLGGGTTLRRVTPDGANSNLGPGPQPELAAFLTAIEAHLAEFG